MIFVVEHFFFLGFIAELCGHLACPVRNQFCQDFAGFVVRRQVPAQAVEFSLRVDAVKALGGGNREEDAASNGRPRLAARRPISRASRIGWLRS